MKIIDRFLDWLSKQVLSLEETNLIIFPNEKLNNTYAGFRLISDCYFTKKNSIYIHLKFNKDYDVLRIIRVCIKMKYDKDGKQHKKLLYNELMQDNQTTIKCIINPDPESNYEVQKNEFLIVTVYYSKIK